MAEVPSDPVADAVESEAAESTSEGVLIPAIVAHRSVPVGLRPYVAMRDKFRTQTDMAFRALVKIALSEKTKDADRIAAIRTILARGWGAEKTALELEPDDDEPQWNVANLNDEELMQLRGLIAKARGKAP